VRPARADEEQVYTRTAIEGFFAEEAPEGMDELFGGFFEAGNGAAFLAWEEKQCRAIGAAAIAVYDGVALCFGDATPPQFRRRGVQSALIAARLAAGAAAGCPLGMAVTLPGSASQRNYERQGFHVVYTRTKFAREWKSEKG
jgi:GNAT superfamily N-acetyltransferase